MCLVIAEVCLMLWHIVCFAVIILIAEMIWKEERVMYEGETLSARCVAAISIMIYSSLVDCAAMMLQRFQDGRE